MDKVYFINRIMNQAYEQAPWRRQMQMIGIILLTVIVVALVAGINLNVTSRAATLGREIQDMSMSEFEALNAAPPTSEEEEEPLTIEDYKILIADLEAELAILTSAEVMRERAEDLGFVKVSQDELMYVRVAGSSGRPEARLAPDSKPITTGARLMPLAYRESLVDWLKDELSQSWLLRSPTDLLLKGVNP